MSPRYVAYSAPWFEERERQRGIRVVVYAAAITAVLLGAWKGCAHYVARGEDVRDAMPPRVVADKSHTVESHSYSCGKACVSTSNTDVWTLLADDGGRCDVDRKTFARVREGAEYKCPNLYGWRD